MRVRPPERGRRGGGGRGLRRPCRLLGPVLLAAAISAGAPAAAAGPEVTLNEFWPEIDVFVRLDPQWRLLLLGVVSRAMETGISTEGTVGVHLDYAVPTLPEGLVAALPGIEEYWSMSLRTGYNRLAARNPVGPAEDRLLLEATVRSRPMWQALRLANRNRLDLRWIGDESSWRYRNRTRVERTWALPRPSGDALVALPAWAVASAATPYLTAEFFWDSRWGAWSRRVLETGVEFEVAHDRTVAVYLNRQLDLRIAGARLTALGVVLTLNY
jgi:hypothetical protein